MTVLEHRWEGRVANSSDGDLLHETAIVGPESSVAPVTLCGLIRKNGASLQHVARGRDYSASARGRSATNTVHMDVENNTRGTCEGECGGNSVVHEVRKKELKETGKYWVYVSDEVVYVDDEDISEETC